MAVIDRQFRTGRRHVLAGAASAAALTQLPRPGRAEGLARLKYWDMVWGPPEYIDTAKSLVAQFNAAHPAIQVEYRSISWSNWYQTFLTAIGAGSAPDMSTGAGFRRCSSSVRTRYCRSTAWWRACGRAGSCRISCRTRSRR